MPKTNKDKTRRANAKATRTKPSAPTTPVQSRPETVHILDSSSLLPLIMDMPDANAAELLVKIHNAQRLLAPTELGAELPWVPLTPEMERQILRTPDLQGSLDAVLQLEGDARVRVEWRATLRGQGLYAGFKRVGVRIDQRYYGWLKEKRPLSSPETVLWTAEGSHVHILTAITAVGGREITDIARSVDWDSDSFFATRAVLAAYSTDDALKDLLNQLKAQPVDGEDGFDLRVLKTTGDAVWAMRQPHPGQPAEVTVMFSNEY